jgi:hypothetical protein
MVKMFMALFEPVKFEFGKIHISGGYVSKPMSTITKTIDDVDGIKKTFVKMSTVESWLIMCVCGQSSKNKSSFERTSLLEIIHDRIGRMCDGVDDIAGGAVPVGNPEDYDPMSELGVDIASSGPNAAVGLRVRGRQRYYRNMANNCIVTVNLAARCAEVDPTCTQMRPVKLYIEDRQKCWLSLDDVEWALKYLFTQNQLKGVPLVGEDDAGPGAVLAA